MAILSHSIQKWLSSTPIIIQEEVMTLPTHLQPITSRAIYEQFDISWLNNATRSLLSKQWAQAASIHHATSTGKYDNNIGNGHSTEAF
jgi:hypothetical protein